MALQLSFAEKIIQNTKIQQESAQTNFPDINFRKMDEAVVNFFDKTYPLLIDGRKVPVVFAGPERWAQVQRDSYMKDKDGMLILPVIAVRRGSPEINLNRHVPKSNETNIVIKKVRKNKINNQKEIVNQKPVYDCYMIPYPRFVIMNYTIIIWASHYAEINDFQQRYLWEGAHYTLSNEKFWFISHIQSISDTSNTEDNTRQERIQKVEYSLTLDGYISNSKDIKKIPSINNIDFKLYTEENDFLNNNTKYNNYTPQGNVDIPPQPTNYGANYGKNYGKNL